MRIKNLVQLESDAAVDRPHVGVDVPARLEGGEARPADVGIAARARHVVAARHTLDGDLAARAVLDVVPHLPRLEQLLVLGVPVLARPALVVLHVAVAANPHEARWTLQNRASCGFAVDLGAVGRRAVVELVRARVDVGKEGRVHDGVELVRGKELLRDGKGDVV
ncbi:hypothetical protein GSI_10792 [Ganoderma sinense ZZ0214-1]|uniref:Uncharacterized protein n=1 Tax=Ganoderma sinense ZZ0214-1 TaxID=1077348 RepID=A0A2G8S1I6_9APHY|nr:hypothetical protein GSI_10792 [Ganoderma sinense ZZ0214-1]